MPHYFITGVSSGIGEALTTSLATTPATSPAITDVAVSGVARRAERLSVLEEKLAGFTGYACDVADGDGMAAAITSAIAANGPVDVAILNAGMYVPQDGTAIDPTIYAQHMDVNYMGVVNALATLVPAMREAGGGKIVIISSVAGWRGLPKAAAYGPTKAALISLAESLYFDLAPENIALQVICPGFVDSEATAVNDFDMPGLMQPQDAAAEIIAALSTTKFLVHFPKSFTRKLALLRWLPDKLYFALVGKSTGH